MRQIPTRHLLTILLAALLIGGCATNNPSYHSQDLAKEAEKGNVYAIQEMQRKGFQARDNGLAPHSTGGVKDPVGALEKGVARGDALSQARMAHYLLYGVPHNGQSVRDPAKALQLAKAARSNKDLSLRKTAAPGRSEREQANITSERETAVRFLIQRAETLLRLQSDGAPADADSLYALGQIYDSSHRTSGLPSSITSLLWGWRAVDGAPESPADARHWMSQAANAGHLKAMEAMVALSSGAEQQQWQLRLAQAKTTGGDQSDRDMLQMASTFLANQHYQQALTWYRKLAAKGNPSAQKTVLQLTDATAVRLRTAADNGGVNAMFQLGEYFRSGDWQGQDSKQALAWYLKAADKGHSASAYQAALLTTSDWDKRELMYKARNLGNKEAERWLAVDEQDRIQAGERLRQQQAEEQRQQRADQQALVSRIDREGSTDIYEINVYCSYGGKRCAELRSRANQAQKQRNREAEAANQQRLWDVYSGGADEEQRRMEGVRSRTECLQEKRKAQDRYNRGLQDWHYTGDC